MFYKASLAVAAAAAVSASPIEQRDSTVNLPLAKHSTVTSIQNIVARDQANIRKINSNSQDQVNPSSGTVTNEDVSYVAPVSIGGKTYQLIVDTGCKSLTQEIPH